jgi:predicted DNA-binding protein
MDTAVLSFRLPASTAARFVELAQRTKLRKPSRLLKHLVSEALRQQGVAAEPVLEPSLRRLDGPTVRIATRLPVDDARRLHELAEAFGGASAWLRSRVKAALGDAHALPAAAEVQALHDATLELLHVGNNLNQVARALNEARAGGRAPPIDRVTPDLLQSLALRVETLAEKNEAVIGAAQRRGRAT